MFVLSFLYRLTHARGSFNDLGTKLSHSKFANSFSLSNEFGNSCVELYNQPSSDFSTVTMCLCLLLSTNMLHRFTSIGLVSSVETCQNLVLVLSEYFIQLWSQVLWCRSPHMHWSYKISYLKRCKTFFFSFSSKEKSKIISVRKYLTLTFHSKLRSILLTINPKPRKKTNKGSQGFCFRVTSF